MKCLTRLMVLVALLQAGVVFARSQDEHANINAFFQAVSQDPERANEALDEIAAVWRDGYTAILVELARVVSPPVRGRLIAFLEQQTGQGFGSDLAAWRQWMWQLPYQPHPAYGLFKSALYSRIDPRMAAFFPAVLPTTIRLDEVEWGGVRVNGIPPLDYPVHLDASEADYLDDGDVVFGIALNGDAMAYPKRILAWHEMARCSRMRARSAVSGDFSGQAGSSIGRTSSFSTRRHRVCGRPWRAARSSGGLRVRICFSRCVLR
jgi:hypothetical protein